jgi:hypothetical protein
VPLIWLTAPSWVLQLDRTSTPGAKMSVHGPQLVPPNSGNDNAAESSLRDALTVIASVTRDGVTLQASFLSLPDATT